MINVDGPDLDSSMAYNGLGQRLIMEAGGVTTEYVMEGNTPLIADAGGNATTFLYGLGPVAEKTTTWNYALPDVANTQRQLTDASGEVTFAARYTPWGDGLQTYGTGNFEFGYFGGLMDEANGLLYVGNGQYYDPASGRFLTRDAKSNTNPYVPFDPTGALIGPLGLMAVFLGRRKKASKWNSFLMLLIVIICVSFGVASCSTELTPGSTITATGTQVPGTNIYTGTVTVTPPDGPSTTESGAIIVTPDSPINPLAVPCPTPIETPTPAIDLISLQPNEVTGSNFDPYIQAVANKYSIELPTNQAWITYFYNEYLLSPDSPTYYGVTPINNYPAGDGGVFQDPYVYITNFAFSELSQIEFASVLVHESRHAWYEYKYEEEDNPLNFPKYSETSMFGPPFTILTEYDAHGVQLEWLKQNGVSSGDFYNNTKNDYNKHRANFISLQLNTRFTIPLGYCQPLWC